MDGNGTAAAVRAGYSAKTARSIANENLTKPAIKTAVETRQAADATRLSIARDDVVAGLLEAVKQAREQGNPLGMIRGWSELGRMLGYFSISATRVEKTPGVSGVLSDIANMSDDELSALIQKAEIS